MKKLTLLFFMLTLSLFASNIKVDDAYARATPPNLPNSAAFLTITNNTSSDVALISAKSSIAKSVELHTHDMKDGIMKMYQVPQIDIKANASTVLKPGGFHVMFIGLTKKPLKEGQTVDLALTFSNKQTISLNIPVKSVMGGMMKHKNMKHGSCGQGKCGSNMKQGMSCGQGKCGSGTKKPMSCGQGKCGSN